MIVNGVILCFYYYYYYYYCLRLLIIASAAGTELSTDVVDALFVADAKELDDGGIVPPMLEASIPLTQQEALAMDASTSTRHQTNQDDEFQDDHNESLLLMERQEESFCLPSLQHAIARTNIEPFLTCKQQKKQKQQKELDRTNDTTTRDHNEGRLLSKDKKNGTITTTATNTTTTTKCGPNCRPSCLTLKLNVTKASLFTATPSSSSWDGNDAGGTTMGGSSSCRHTKSSSSFLSCQSPNECLLEDSKCLGPILYEDTIGWIQKQHFDPKTSTSTTSSSRNNTSVEDLIPIPPSCSYIPGNDYRLDRFRGWPMVQPMTVQCDITTMTTINHTIHESIQPCFGNNDRIRDEIVFFEFCNVIHEDPQCDQLCNNDSTTTTTTTTSNQNTTKACSRHVAPFGDGWTSFVVSASLSSTVDTTSSSASYDTGIVPSCWMQRIDLYFPPQCPYCHECPLVSLGDRFGELEVVGFGHSIGQPCAGCNGTVEQHPDMAILDCHQLQQCQFLKDCETGKMMGLPSFLANNCSWSSSLVSTMTTVVDDDDDDYPLVQEDGLNQQQGDIYTNDEHDQPRDQSNVGQPPKVDDDASSSSTQKKETDTDDSSSFRHMISNMAPVMIVSICLAIFSMVLLFIVLQQCQKRKRRKVEAEPASDNNHRFHPEEIVYFDDDDEERIMNNLFLETASNDSSSVVPMSRHQIDQIDMVRTKPASKKVVTGIEEEEEGEEETVTSNRQSKSCCDNNGSKHTRTLVAAVKFRTASLIHQPGKDEVEVVETTGIHHVPVRWF